MRSFRNRFSLSILVFCALPLAVAQNDLCVDKSNVDTHTPPCSFTALNRDCTLTIDRLRPVAPPTIYAKHGSKITVTVLHPSPFEDLTLDLKSATAIVPTDTFKTVFDALSGDIEKIAVKSVTRGAVNKSAPRGAEVTQTEKAQIAKKQNELLDALRKPLVDALDSLSRIKAAIQPPPGDVCYEKEDKAQAWLFPDKWKKDVEAGLTLQITIEKNTTEDTTAARNRIKTFDTQITAYTKSTNATPDGTEELNTNQKTLNTLVSDINIQFKPDGHLAHLRKVIHNLKYSDLDSTQSYTIADLQPTKDANSKAILNNQNDLSESWTLDYTNTLFAKVTFAMSDTTDTSDSLEDEVSEKLSELKSIPGKQTADTINVQYQSPPRIETSVGLMLPTLPYHSYASAAAASGGTITGYVVQELKTYAVVPSVQVNFVAYEWILKQQRAALFGTVAVGYNSATSNVEFGVGPSFSWKTILISGLLDIGRDKKLAGGFTVGESLGTTSVTPLTSDVWRIKPAVGISVRIPLGK